MLLLCQRLHKGVWSCAGWAVSAYFGYLKGVSNELALKHVPYVVPRNDTLAGPRGRRGDQVPSPILCHFSLRNDLQLCILVRAKQKAQICELKRHACEPSKIDFLHRFLSPPASHQHPSPYQHLQYIAKHHQNVCR